MGLLRALSGFVSALHLFSSEGSHNAIYPGTPEMHPRILFWGTPDFAYKLQGLACSMTGLACSRPSRCKGKCAALPNRASGACTSTCTYTYTCACRCLLGRGIGLFAIPCVYVRIHMHMRVRIGPRRALSSSVGCARVRMRIQLCRPLKLCRVLKEASVGPLSGSTGIHGALYVSPSARAARFSLHGGMRCALPVFEAMLRESSYLSYLR